MVKIILRASDGSEDAIELSGDPFESVTPDAVVIDFGKHACRVFVNTYKSKQEPVFREARGVLFLKTDNAGNVKVH